MSQFALNDLPVIAVITPNYNYGEYLEATIDSILSQGYPNLRYLVIDGGSTDQSVEIIKRYESHIHYWHSRPDLGQADAIKQGLSQANSALVNWINSDDQLAPGSLFHIAECHLSNPSSLVAASVVNHLQERPEIKEVVQQDELNVHSIIAGHATFHQPGLWWNTERLKSLDGLESDLHYCFDYLLLLRYLNRWPNVIYSNQVVAYFALHPTSKTSTSQPLFDQERLEALRILLSDDEFIPYHKAISQRLRTHEWHRQLQHLTDNTDSPSSYQKVATILLQSLKEPAIRINRFTAGAIRRLLA